jgi:hypothetical protein
MDGRLFDGKIVEAVFLDFEGNQKVEIMLEN